MWGAILGDLLFSILGHFCNPEPLSYSIKEMEGTSANK